MFPITLNMGVTAKAHFGGGVTANPSGITLGHDLWMLRAHTDDHSDSCLPLSVQFAIQSFLFFDVTTSQHTSLRNNKLKSRICNSVYRFLAVSSLDLNHLPLMLLKYFQLASVSLRLSFSYIANWKASLGGLMNNFTWFFPFFPTKVKAGGRPHFVPRFYYSARHV